jgi:hypothetical protein
MKRGVKDYNVAAAVFDFYHAPGGGYNYYNVNLSAGTFLFYKNTGNVGDFPIPTDTAALHHYAFVYDDVAKTATLYVDGSISHADSTMGAATLPMDLGGYAGNTVQWGAPLGTLVDVGIFTRALSAAEVASIAGKGVATIGAGAHVAVATTSVGFNAGANLTGLARQSIGAASRVANAFGCAIGAAASVAQRTIRGFGAAASIFQSDTPATFGAGATVQGGVSKGFGAGAYLVPEVLQIPFSAAAFIVPVTVKATLSAAAAIGQAVAAVFAAGARIGVARRTVDFVNRVERVRPVQRITSAFAPYKTRPRER